MAIKPSWEGLKMMFYVDKHCNCGKLIKLAEIDCMAGNTYKMPGIYYRCPHCGTGRFIPKEKAARTLTCPAANKPQKTK